METDSWPYYLMFKGATTLYEKNTVRLDYGRSTSKKDCRIYSRGGGEYYLTILRKGDEYTAYIKGEIKTLVPTTEKDWVNVGKDRERELMIKEKLKGIKIITRYEDL